MHPGSCAIFLNLWAVLKQTQGSAGLFGVRMPQTPEISWPSHTISGPPRAAVPANGGLYRLMTTAIRLLSLGSVTDQQYRQGANRLDGPGRIEAGCVGVAGGHTQDVT